MRCKYCGQKVRPYHTIPICGNCAKQVMVGLPPDELSPEDLLLYYEDHSRFYLEAGELEMDDAAKWHYNKLDEIEQIMDELFGIEFGDRRIPETIDRMLTVK